MSDQSIAARIESLVSEEHELRGRGQQDNASDDAPSWELLRQRRALREADADPEQAHVRDTDTVELLLAVLRPRLGGRARGQRRSVIDFAGALDLRTHT